MAHVVTDKCTKCRNCIEICPVNSFHEGDDQFYINAETCIDCGACCAECPSEAIFSEDDLPEDAAKFKDINKEQATKFPQAS